jgi:thermostable 8-oxoguanine DNA glycosylase
MQTMVAKVGADFKFLELPDPDDEVVPGVGWGAFDQLFTPAFWAGRVWIHSFSDNFSSYQLGVTFEEEVVACLLGGYGMRAEIGLAAFQRVRGAGIFSGTFDQGAVERLLSTPLVVGGKEVKYRFPRQKARYLTQTLAILRASSALPASSRTLRDYLKGLPGIGLKTASWIVRNWLKSDEVAIVDIHIYRAGQIAGIFPEHLRSPQDYLELEERFLGFAEAIKAKPSCLDNLIWQYMRRLRHLTE